MELMLIELKFFKNIDALVWIITAQIGQLVNEIQPERPGNLGWSVQRDFCR